MGKGAGVAFLIIGILLIVFFFGFTYTTSPIKYIFLLGGVVCIIISIASFAQK